MKFKIAKIVGAADETNWGQVHYFKPEGEKKEQYGELLAAVGFKAKKEGVEVDAFGMEIIQRLQEIYYSNESETILKKLNQTVESLAAEFISEVELNLVMAIAWKEYFYAAKFGGGQVYLKRGEDIVGLLPEGESGSVSGKLIAGDKIALGTKQFRDKVKEENIKLALNKPDLQQAEEDLAGQVHSDGKSFQSAAILMAVETETEEVAVEEKAKIDWKNLGHKLAAKIPRINLNLAKKAVFLREGGDSRSKKSAATVAIVLALIFGISLVLAGNKRQKTKSETREQAVLEEVKYKYDEAQGLTSLNPLRAKSLLKDSQIRIQEYKEESKKDLPKELQELADKIEAALGGVQREYHLDSATEWYDFGLVKEGFKGSDWEAEDKQVLVWDEKNKDLVSVNLETKAGEAVSEGDDFGGGKLIGLAGERGMVVSNAVITVVEIKTGKKIGEVGADEWGKIADAVGFGAIYTYWIKVRRGKFGNIWQ